MRDVATRTGAQLIDFVTAGAREVRGRLFVPRKYLVTNAYFDADRVINVANCRSHQGIGISGAMKNMFGCVIGLRKLLIHNLFPGQPKAFARVIADIYGSVRPDVSFLDLTTVVEGAGINTEIRPVGLVLASTDAVALDTVASHTIGYDQLPLWISHFGGRFGLGSNSLDQIDIRGVDWDSMDKPRLKLPWMPDSKASFYDCATALINNTWMRPRPVIATHLCTQCGECVDRCPVKCIMPASAGLPYRIDLAKCADCGCCLRVCEPGAVNLSFVGLPRMLRRVLNRLPERVEPPVPTVFDPAAPNLPNARTSTPVSR
jgi:ferredoxin